jgi:hypothetical protein
VDAKVQRLRHRVADVVDLAHALALLLGEVAPHDEAALAVDARLPLAASLSHDLKRAGSASSAGQ